MFFNVKDFGASGDARQLCTSNIQQAIDEASRAGGGTVVFPAGTYLSGSIHLRSNVGLHLQNGATILGSPNPEDYNKDDFCVQNQVFPIERVSGAHLICAVEVENVSITGFGRIDGNRQAFSDRTWAEHPHLFEYPPWRPGQMLYFCESSRINIENVQLYNAPYWTCFLHGCEDVTINGLKIWNDQRTWNGDGIDIDCCCRVTISNCNIDSGDDCLTLRGNLRPLKDQSRICEHVTISNCILRARTNAFRIGVGNGCIRDCIISNCVVRDTRTGICIISKYMPQSQGVHIENILFNNIYLDCQRPLLVSSDMRGSQDEPAKTIRNISFNHLRGKGRRSCYVTGNKGAVLENISFNDVRFEYGKVNYDPKRDDPEHNYGEACQATTNSAFYLLNAQKLSFENVRIDWQDEGEFWRSALHAENIQGLQQHNCTFSAPAAGTDCIVK